MPTMISNQLVGGLLRTAGATSTPDLPLPGQVRGMTGGPLYEGVAARPEGRQPMDRREKSHLKIKNIRYQSLVEISSLQGSNGILRINSINAILRIASFIHHIE